MIASGIDATPMAMWNWGIDHGFGTPNEQVEELIRFHLMAKSAGTVQAGGIHFAGMFYVSEDGNDDARYSRARAKGREAIDLWHDHTDPQFIWIRAADKSLARCVLRASEVRYRDLRLEEILDMLQMVKFLPPSQRHTRLANKALGQQDRYSSRYRSKTGIPEMIQRMEQLASTYFIGALFIDELQHLNAAKTGGIPNMLNFFVNLINSIGIPVVFTGTNSMVNLFSDVMRNARRACGLGIYDFKQPMQNDPFWDMLVNVAWSYQWVQKPAPLTPEIRKVLYEHTQGITDLLAKLLILGQRYARYCHQCRIEDTHQHGIAYWHRAHQLPGAWLCVTHAEPLIEVHTSWLCSHRHNLLGHGVLRHSTTHQGLNDPAHTIHRKADDNRKICISAALDNGSVRGCGRER
jgi:hypothetical protein